MIFYSVWRQSFGYDKKAFTGISPTNAFSKYTYLLFAIILQFEELHSLLEDLCLLFYFDCLLIHHVDRFRKFLD